MSAAAERPLVPYQHVDQLREARSVIREEAEALLRICGELDTAFCAAVELMHACRGRILVSGIGKAGLIGRKIAATLASTGSPAHFLHPTEAVHGDLGCLLQEDILLVLSNSGETAEVVQLAAAAKDLHAAVIALTASERSSLGTLADVVVRLGRLQEAGIHRLAPTTSTTAMLVLGDALALVLARMRGLTPDRFARWHPAGSLGRRLRSVQEVMRRGDQLRIAHEADTVREALRKLSRPGRRTGAVIVVDDDGRLSGLFTDSDLVRLLERRRDDQLDRPISQVMTRRPRTLPPHATLDEAVAVLSTHHLSEMPIVDGEGRPLGLVDITDVIGLVPVARID